MEEDTAVEPVAPAVWGLPVLDVTLSALEQLPADGGDDNRVASKSLNEHILVILSGSHNDTLLF